MMGLVSLKEETGECTHSLSLFLRLSVSVSLSLCHVKKENAVNYQPEKELSSETDHVTP